MTGSKNNHLQLLKVDRKRSERKKEREIKKERERNK
jgi:hypothetical protein